MTDYTKPAAPAPSQSDTADSIMDMVDEYGISRYAVAMGDGDSKESASLYMDIRAAVEQLVWDKETAEKYAQEAHEANVGLDKRMRVLDEKLFDAEQDAARYRWIRDHALDICGPDFAPVIYCGVCDDPRDLDAVMDAALKEGK